MQSRIFGGVLAIVNRTSATNLLGFKALWPSFKAIIGNSSMKNCIINAVESTNQNWV